MKKTFLLLVIAMFIVSCNDSSKDIQMKNVDLVANSGDWVANVDKDGLNLFYSCHFSMPEITQGVYDNGLVTAYIVLDNPTAQEVLPFVRHFQNKAGSLWTQTIDFDYVKGGINVYVTNSDFAVDPPAKMTFRVVVM
jgi:alanine racemase